MWKQFHKIYTLLVREAELTMGYDGGYDSFDFARAQVCCYSFQYSPRSLRLMWSQSLQPKWESSTQLEIYPNESEVEWEDDSDDGRDTMA